MKKFRFLLLGGTLLASSFVCGAAQAHDTWVQTNTNVVRIGDAVHIDLMLGNHGNNHRDFKLAGKVDLSVSTLQVIDPKGKKYDLQSQLFDVGYTPNEGFWTTKFVAAKPGIYTVVQTFDKVMSYAPVRDIKSAKTFFLASKSLDQPGLFSSGFDRRLGFPFELVAESNPIAPMGPGIPLTLRLFYRNKPLPNVKISFIPQGETLKDGFDARYEQRTNVNGRVRFTPTSANYYLIAAHYEAPNEKGKGYDGTNYSATMTLYVPQICPCCGG